MRLCHWLDNGRKTPDAEAPAGDQAKTPGAEAPAEYQTKTPGAEAPGAIVTKLLGAASAVGRPPVGRFARSLIWLAQLMRALAYSPEPRPLVPLRTLSVLVSDCNTASAYLIEMP